MSSLDTTPCKGPNCGRPVVWATVRRDDGTPGKVPLDPRAPVYEVTGAGAARAGSYVAERRGTAYVSHFATCPDAGRFSRGRPAGQPGRGELEAALEENRKLKDEVATLRERLRRRGEGLFDGQGGGA